jgi:DNA-binding winged helix-turn-helix (wHTH) protein
MLSGCEFGPFRLEPVHRILTRAGKQVAITAKVFDLLIYLVERRGTLVEKDELLTAIWPNTAIQDANLSQSIFLLRRALGETGKSNRFIVTVPGRGYSFVADVRELLPKHAQPVDTGHRRDRFRRTAFGAAALAAACLAVGAVRFGPALSGSVASPPRSPFRLRLFKAVSTNPRFLRMAAAWRLSGTARSKTTSTSM